jgi:PPOX class probable F420-dependent enzyme
VAQARGDAGIGAAKRLADASNRLYARIRHPQAWDAEASEGGDLEPLRGHKYALLQTFRKSGEGIPTPVWFGLADGKLYFRTYADALKIKRIRNNPRVLVGPCDVRGKPKGALIEARARILPAEQEEHAEDVLQSNYGLFRRIYERTFAMKVEGAYVEVSPT